MIRLSTWFAAALVLGQLNTGPVAAGPPLACHGKDLTRIAGLAEARARRADDLVNADGLLWRIDRPSHQPSYLYGTIHSTDDDAIAMARRAAEQIATAKVVATELGGPMDAEEKANLGAAMIARALDRDHDTFADAAPKDRAGIEGLVGDLGYPAEFAHHLKLWFLAVLTAAGL
jgi:uncharacterized protein YbaP (TraB family)